MSDKLHLFAQYILPQHLLSRFAGWVAECRATWFKDFVIQRFVRKYDVNMRDAVIENPSAYANFNDFFTRKLKPELRPIAREENIIASPVDGCVSQIGNIDNTQLFQAKGFYFDLVSLLGGDQALATPFINGKFTTLYLAPRDYHRIHMPIDGTLIKTIYVPGKLFSVNRNTAEHIPNLFSRNERLICIFDTKIGKMAVILVGAMIVGSIQLTPNATDTSLLKKGDELGYFKLGSTVILLFEKNKIAWESAMNANAPVKMGEGIGVEVAP